MQILFDYLDVLLKSYVVLDVFFGKSYAHEESVIELFIHAEIITDEILPGFTSDFHGYTFFECISESPCRGQIDFIPYLW